jgi:gamma-glutamyltranspeptidase/glutathione hydrolase
MSVSRSTTRRGAIATPHYLATRAGEQAYLDGGSAVDATLAAAAVLAVVYPHNTGLGGDSVSLVRTPDGETACINATGYAGSEVSAELMIHRHGSSLPTSGIDTVTVPGVVRGWEVLAGFGSRLGWEQYLLPAIRLAGRGFPVPRSLAGALERGESTLRTDPGCSGIFFDRGERLVAGQTLRQPALARTLTTLAAEGPDAFYDGQLASAIVAALREMGSSLNARDFEEFRPEVTEPLMSDIGGTSVMTSPPNTQGFLLLRFLDLLRAPGYAAPMGAGAGALAGLFDDGNSVRDMYLSDPRYRSRPAAELIAMPPPVSAPVGPVADPRVPRGDTVGIAAIDSDGFAVSQIQSLFHHFGSAVMDPETGVLFHNRGSSFSLHMESSNVIEPRKRPSHTLMPVMTVGEDGLVSVNACMGGRAQAQIHAQLILRQRSGATAAETVGAPRFVVGPLLAGEESNTIHVEEDAPVPLLDSLRSTGMPVQVVPQRSEMCGHANVVVATENGGFDGASDPRSDGSAAVVELPPR